MPEECLTKSCIDCESHAIVGGKLDCNYMNRLGLSQPTVKTFMEGHTTAEDVEVQIKVAEARVKELKKKKEGLEENKDGSVS